MGSKDFQLALLKFLDNSIDLSCRCVQKHPIVSGIVISAILLYAFFPLIFMIVICSSPIVACIIIYNEFNWIKKKLKDSIVEGNEKENRAVSSKENKKDGGFSREGKSSKESPRGSRIEHPQSAREHVTGINRGNRSLITQKSRRRNFKGSSRALNAAQSLKEMDTAFLTSIDRDFTGITVRIDDKPKTTMEEKENYAVNHDNLSSCNASDTEKFTDSRSLKPETDFVPPKPDSSTEEPLKVDGSVDEIGSKCLKGAQDREEEKDDQTEDDEENQMDLGESELERNRRLESLIAKRKARRLLGLQVEKALLEKKSSPSTITPISIEKVKDMYVSSSIGDPSMPGSAPSVLLPTTNPFDIPYDPSEEKPNLMADSFQQEFGAIHQKEMFCRHESFSLGPSFPLESKHDQCISKMNPLFLTNRRVGRLDFSRFRTQSDSGKHDQRVEQILSQEDESASHINDTSDRAVKRGEIPTVLEVECENNRRVDESNNEKKGKETENVHDKESNQGYSSDVQVVADGTDDDTGKSVSSSSEENEETFEGRRVLISTGKVPEEFSTAVHKFLTYSLSKKAVVSEPPYDSSPTENDTQFMDESMHCADKGSCHTPSLSIASDLVVEVSEVGSPPSASDTEPLTYDEDVVKEDAVGSEDAWAPSSEQSRTKTINVVKDDTVSSEDTWALSSQQLGTKTIDYRRKMPVGLIGVNSGFEDVAEFFTPKEEASADPCETVPHSSSSNIFIQKIHDKVKQVVEESLGKVHQLSPRPQACSPNDNTWQRLGELSLHSAESQEGAACGVNAGIAQRNANSGASEFTGERYREHCKSSLELSNPRDCLRSPEHIYSDPRNFVENEQATKEDNSPVFEQSVNDSAASTSQSETTISDDASGDTTNETNDTTSSIRDSTKETSNVADAEVGKTNDWEIEETKEPSKLSEVPASPLEPTKEHTDASGPNFMETSKKEDADAAGGDLGETKVSNKEVLTQPLPGSPKDASNTSIFGDLKSAEMEVKIFTEGSSSEPRELGEKIAVNRSGDSNEKTGCTSNIDDITSKKVAENSSGGRLSEPKDSVDKEPNSELAASASGESGKETSDTINDTEELSADTPKASEVPTEPSGKSTEVPNSTNNINDLKAYEKSVTNPSNGSVNETNDSPKNATITEPTKASSEQRGSVNDTKYSTKTAIALEPGEAPKVTVNVNDSKDSMQDAATAEPTKAFRVTDGANDAKDSTKTAASTEPTEAPDITGSVNDNDDSTEDVTTSEITKAFEVTGRVDNTKDSINQLTTTEQPNVEEEIVKFTEDSISDTSDSIKKETATDSPKRREVAVNTEEQSTKGPSSTSNVDILEDSKKRGESSTTDCSNEAKDLIIKETTAEPPKPSEVPANPSQELSEEISSTSNPDDLKASEKEMVNSTGGSLSDSNESKKKDPVTDSPMPSEGAADLLRESTEDISKAAAVDVSKVTDKEAMNWNGGNLSETEDSTKEVATSELSKSSQASNSPSQEITKEAINSNNDDDLEASTKKTASSIGGSSIETIYSTKITIATEPPNTDKDEQNNSSHEKTKKDELENKVTERSKPNEDEAEVIHNNANEPEV